MDDIRSDSDAKVGCHDYRFIIDNLITYLCAKRFLFLGLQMEQLAALHHECMARAKEIAEQSGVKIPDEIASFVTETTFRFCQILASDLESFGRHAKRSIINMDDVVLFARRNPHLVILTLMMHFLLD